MATANAVDEDMNIVSYPNAKVNLGLRIIEKRGDGFHNLETLFVPVNDFTDILEVVESKSLYIKHYGLSYSLPENKLENDLCIKAYKLLREDFDIPPVGIYLYKKIPVGAGLGGGSADAAFTLKTLNSLYKLNLTEESLAGYAAKLGSDCPFFIYNRPMFGEGKGEILSEFSASWVSELFGKDAKYRIELRCSSIAVSTAEAYHGIIPCTEGRGLRSLLEEPVSSWKGKVLNDFEEGVFAKHPSLLAEKEKLYAEGAEFALMSGSGSAVYGIFRN